MISEGSGETPGQLILVGTPIGNLGDLSDRARAVLTSADLICCEDTRRTRGLLSAFGISAKGATGDRLLSVHEHNEAGRAAAVIRCVAGGGMVAVVTDAGMPGISDPGSLLVEAVIEAGYQVSVVPGATSVIAALVVSGLPTDRFSVEGFLPRKGGERRERLQAVMADERTTVFLEAPGRVAATLADLAEFDPARRVAVVRELTKVHEEVWRGRADLAATEWAAREVRGEVVLVVAGAEPAGPVSDESVEAAVRQWLASGSGDGPRQIAEALSDSLGVARRRVYEAVLQIRGEP
ncbi:MAG TPA: 16S rRNA (cytidine(1402)-2'-O)-methyltransferase [Acidimicrobiales bacterium]